MREGERALTKEGKTYPSSFERVRMIHRIMTTLGSGSPGESCSEACQTYIPGYSWDDRTCPNCEGLLRECHTLAHTRVGPGLKVTVSLQQGDAVFLLRQPIQTADNTVMPSSFTRA